jgi:hypothetical protein
VDLEGERVKRREEDQTEAAQKEPPRPDVCRGRIVTLRAQSFEVDGDSGLWVAVAGLWVAGLGLELGNAVPSLPFPNPQPLAPNP